MSTAEHKKHKLALKDQHLNQLAKLTFKSEADIEFFEVVRDYMKSRADIEQQHSKALEKLAKTFSQKRFRKYLGPSPSPLFLQGALSPSQIPQGDKPAVSADNGEAPPQPEAPSPLAHASPSTRKVYQSFSTLLAETEAQAKTRNAMAEGILSQISDVLKEYYKQKATLTKRNIEFGAKYHHEIIVAWEEVDRTRMIYEKAAKDHESSQKKYDESLKKPKSGLASFKTLVTGKDANSVIEHYKAKCKNRLRQMHDSRNNYLLALSGFNAIQDLYQKEDLPLLMAKIDGSYYLTLTDLLTKYADFENLVSQSVDGSMQILRENVALISRPEEVKYFLDDFKQTFNDNAHLLFENVGIDECKEVFVDDVTKIALGQKLGQMLVIDAALISQQEAKEKELKGAQQLLDIYNTSEKHEKTASPLTPMDLVSEVSNALDLIKCQRVKYGTQMDTLRRLNVAPIMPENTDTAAGKQLATVKFTHNAETDDQLNATEGDELEILDTGAEGFVKAKNVKTGAIGNIPTSYILFVQKAPIKTVTKIVVALYDHDAEEEHEVSFNVGDEIECTAGIDPEEEWWEGKVLRTGQIGAFPRSFTKGWEAVVASQNAALAVVGKASQKLQAKRISSMSIKKSSAGNSTAPSLHVKESSENAADASNLSKIPEQTGFSATVLYSYDASCDGELTIEEGEVITDIHKNTGDEQWWHGRGKNGAGQFPQNYVQILESVSEGNEGNEVAEQAPEIKVKALYDFSPTSPGELSFKAGDILIVRQSDEVDWWDGELNGEIGAFPAAYVERIES